MNASSSDNPLTSSLTVMVRWISLFILVYYAYMGATVMITGYTFYGTVLLISAAVLLAVLFSTYYTNPELSIGVMSLDIVVSTGVITVGFGWRSSFQNMIYIMIMILWYDQAVSIARKFIFSAILAACVCTISAITPFASTVLNVHSVEYQVLVYSNICLFSLCFAFVAYFFCEKYAKAAHKLQEYNTELRKMADSDPLTKLMNRRSIMDELKGIIISYKNNGTPVSIAIGDIDFFKKVNDTYGHDCGDYVLEEVAGMFVKFMENKGIVGRWGGEEFLFVFSNMNGDDAFAALETLRMKIENHDFCFNGSIHLKVTMTFGLEEFCLQDGIEQTIKSSDGKLYLGKESGRNKVVY